MNAIQFVKMSGLGNDFIIVDNRCGLLSEPDIPILAKHVCTRRLSLGADELMVIERPTSNGDFSMRTFNPDGNEVEMCGNAARCVARYAYTKNIAGRKMTIDTRGGPVEAWVDDEVAWIQLQLTSIPRLNQNIQIADETITLQEIHISGTPHAVVFVDDLSGLTNQQLLHLGAMICHHPSFSAGTNVNFIQVKDPHHLAQRTYERGVEGETLACGTGAVAASIIAALLGLAASPVQIQTLGGELGVSFSYENGQFSKLILSGGTRFVAEGVLHSESWIW